MLQNLTSGLPVKLGQNRWQRELAGPKKLFCINVMDQMTVATEIRVAYIEARIEY